MNHLHHLEKTRRSLQGDIKLFAWPDTKDDDRVAKRRPFFCPFPMRHIPPTLMNILSSKTHRTMWKLLLDFAFRSIRKHLIPRIDLHPGQKAFVEKAVEIGEKTKDIYTDGDKDNKAQMAQLWEAECEEVLVVATRGAASFAQRDSQAKKRILAILAEAIDHIRDDDEGNVLKLVS